MDILMGCLCVCFVGVEKRDCDTKYVLNIGQTGSSWFDLLQYYINSCKMFMTSFGSVPSWSMGNEPCPFKMGKSPD